LQRKIRKFSEFSGENVDWRSYRTADEMGLFHAFASAVSDQTYQEKLFGSGLPRDAEFIAEMQRLAQSDCVRAFMLFSRGAPVAYLYLPNHGGTLNYAYLGFAPAFRAWSVGTVLHWFAIKELFDEARFQYLDFTEGDGEHKKLFATGSVSSESILFLRDSLFHRVLLRAHLHTNGVSTGAGRILERLGIKSVVRRLIRYGPLGPWRKPS
jgi:CelD/BcsL family acetyltransferase involved in cellulose biosynthesis